MSKLLLWTLLLLAAVPTAMLGAGATFTYQGRLQDNGQPANGIYDLCFSLAAAETNGTYVGPSLTNAPVQVDGGLFTVLLDFGTGAFDGAPRWLEIGVRTNGSMDPYTLLTPRQPITAAPYALFAGTAGAASSSGVTNPMVYGGLTLVSPTNVVLYATNTYVVRSVPGTNSIVVSGAGSPAANGTYRLQSVSPNLVYTKAGRMKLAYLPDDPDYVWQIIAEPETVLYGGADSDFALVGSWVAVAGTPPRPLALAYGVDYVTNYLTQLGVQGASVPGPILGDEIYVNAAIGNDVFAQRGRPDLPFRTVYAALQAADTNDIVRVGPGVYNETFNFSLRPGVKLLGAGKRVTCLYRLAETYAALDLSQSNVLSDFTTDFLICLGGYSFTYPPYGPSSDARLENIEASGVGDVVFASMWQGFRAANCEFTALADCFADGQLDDAGTNAVAELYNCRLAGGWHALANYGRSQIRVFGGLIQDTTVSNSACVFAWDSGRPGASIELTGVSLRHPPPSENGPTYAIANQSAGNCTVTVKGMLLDAADVFGPVNYTGLGLTTNLTVLSPDLATNILCFTNGILMDVK
jgi:hypothetical protein